MMRASYMPWHVSGEHHDQAQLLADCYRQARIRQSKCRMQVP
jgi:hypothetical protein